MHRDFLKRFSSYHKNSPFIIQLYSQLHKGGHNESGCRFSLKKMPALIAYNRKKAQKITLDIGSKQVILAHKCFSDKC